MLNPKRIMYLTPIDLLSNGFDSFVCKTRWNTWKNLLLKTGKLLILVNTGLTNTWKTHPWNANTSVCDVAKGSEERRDPSFQFSLLLSPILSMSLPVTKTEHQQRNVDFLSRGLFLVCTVWEIQTRSSSLSFSATGMEIGLRQAGSQKKFLFKNLNKEEKVSHWTPIYSCLHLFILYLR